MSNLKMFMKENKVKKEDAKYVATKSLKDASGEPLEWTIRAISTKENDTLRDECTIDVQVTGKPNLYRPKFNSSKYIAKMICASVVEPNLNSKELQDSYGVMTPEELIKELVDNPSEYTDLATFVQNFNGFTTIDDKVEAAKN